MTFVTPHLRRTTGGVYNIVQLARRLAARGHRIRLVSRDPVAVRDRVSSRLAGVRVSGIEDDLPDADILVVPADDPEGERLLSLRGRGTPILYLQGFGAPPGPRVRANLGRANRVIAVSRWLEDEARALGCRTRHVASGLDREIFYPGPPASDREPVVSIMTHSKAWKGTGEGLAALEIARNRVPGVQFVLFGVWLPEQHDGELLLRPDRATVGEVFRRSAVFVCPSWEEGLGLPGLEALACGSAIATTDTKGSRDYAVDRLTALVTPPHDPEALGRSIVELLDDNDLRARLALAGSEHVYRQFPEWTVATERFEEALVELI